MIRVKKAQVAILIIFMVLTAPTFFSSDTLWASATEDWAYAGYSLHDAHDNINLAFSNAVWALVYSSPSHLWNAYYYTSFARYYSYIAFYYAYSGYLWNIYDTYANNALSSCYNSFYYFDLAYTYFSYAYYYNINYLNDGMTNALKGDDLNFNAYGWTSLAAYTSKF